MHEMKQVRFQKIRETRQADLQLSGRARGKICTVYTQPVYLQPLKKIKVVLKVNEVDSQKVGFRCWIFNSLIKGTWFPAHGCHKKIKNKKKHILKEKQWAETDLSVSKQMREGIWLIPAVSDWPDSTVLKMSPSGLICSQLDELRPSELTWHLTIITLSNDPGPIVCSLRNLFFCACSQTPWLLC